MWFLPSDILISKNLYQSYTFVYVSMLSYSAPFIFQQKQCNNLPENQNTYVTFKKCSFSLSPEQIYKSKKY